jgi:hypothetical protein
VFRAKVRGFRDSNYGSESVDIVLIGVVMLVVLLVAPAVERKMFQGDPQRKQQFRRRYYLWSFRAAGIALVLAILWVVYLRTVTSH